MRALAARAALVIATICAALSAQPAAAAKIIHVLFIGADTADCGTFPTPFKPCRTLQKGIDRASAGDSVYFDIPVDYGPAVITKSINIFGRNAPGGGTLGPTGACLTVNAGPNDIVRISNWTCTQGGAAKHGIVFNSGRALILDRVAIRDGGGTACGVLFRPNSNAVLSIQDSTIGGFGGGSGVCLIPRNGADVNAWLGNVSVHSNRYGVVSTPGAGSIIQLGMDGADVTGNAVAGIRSNGTASTVLVRDSTISSNGTGLYRPSGGKIASLGGNILLGNTTKGTFSSTVPQK
jgi:hypothetical protein